MGIEKSPQFYSDDGTEKRWYKFCPTDTLPGDVQTQIQELKEKADALRDA